MDNWDYQPVDDFDKTPIERLSAFPRQPDMLWYAVRFVAHIALRMWLKVWHRYRVVGREHLPKDVPFVMVANHASHLDAMCLLSALPLRKIQTSATAAAKDYFFTTVTKVAFAAIVVNAMPFDRKDNPRESIHLCRELLETPGHSLILFPEGTRNPGECGLLPFKSGIYHLAQLRPDVELVPVYLENLHRSLPKGAVLPIPMTCTVRFGPPVALAAGEAKESFLERARAEVIKLANHSK